MPCFLEAFCSIKPSKKHGTFGTSWPILLAFSQFRRYFYFDASKFPSFEFTSYPRMVELWRDGRMRWSGRLQLSLGHFGWALGGWKLSGFGVFYWWLLDWWWPDGVSIWDTRALKYSNVFTVIFHGVAFQIFRTSLLCSKLLKSLWASKPLNRSSGKHSALCRGLDFWKSDVSKNSYKMQQVQ